MPIDLDQSVAGSTTATPEQPGNDSAGETTRTAGSETTDNSSDNGGEQTRETTGSTTTGEEATVDLGMDNITQNEEGEFVWVVKPGDQYSPIYTGKTMKELLSNVAKSTLDKDAFIRKLRASQVREVDLPDRVSGPEAEEEQLSLPDETEVLRDLATKSGVDLAAFGWTEEQWREYETINGTRAALKLENRIQELRRQAQDSTREQSVAILNERTLNKSTDDVMELIADIDVKDPNFSWKDWYDGILAGVMKDAGNFEKTGLLKASVIVKVAAKELRKLNATKVAERATRETEDKIAGARTRREAIPGETGGRGGVRRSTPVTPKTTDEALAQIRREHPEMFPR
jgi:hypothetical protein